MCRLIKLAVVAVMLLFIPVTSNAASLFDGEWTDVDGTFGEEAVNPTKQEDGNKTAYVKLKDSYDGDIIFGVYNADGSLFGATVYDRKTEVKVPATDDYYVKLFNFDLETMKPYTAVQYFTKEEFERNIAYKVPVIEENGKLIRRAAYETENIKICYPEKLECSITDEIQANSGRQCLKVINQNNTFTIFQDTVTAPTSMNATVYVYTAASSKYVMALSCGSVKETIKGSTAAGIWNKISIPLATADRGEQSVTVTLKMSSNYYLDDFCFTAECEGFLRDDYILSGDSYSWTSYWNDVGGRGDETPKDSRDIQILFDNTEEGKTYKAEVYDGNKSLYSSAIGTDNTVCIKVPSADQYYVKLILTDDTGIPNYGIIDICPKYDIEAKTEYKPIELEDDGKHKMRSSFETGYMGNIDCDGMACLSITDKTVANSGSKSLLVSNRTSQITRLKTDKISGTPKVDATVYIKAEQPQKIELHTKFEGKEKTEDIRLVSGYATSTGWLKLSGSIDLSDYSLNEKTNVKIYILTQNTNGSIYVDDFILKTDIAGDTYDDTKLPVYEEPSNMSDTPSVKDDAAAGYEPDIKALKDVYSNYFKIGASVMSWDQRDENLGPIIKKHFNSVTPDGFFKMSSILKKNTDGSYSYDFAGGDSLMDFCFENGIDDVVGHVLIWEHSINADYLKDVDGNSYSRDEALNFMKNYINKVVNHFNGKGDASEYRTDLATDYESWRINSWDVVNEAVSTKDGELYCDKGSFLNAIGTDYVTYAFKYARDADASATLRYNDVEQSDDKLNKICSVVQSVQNEGNYGGRKLIDTVATQSHYCINVPAAYIRHSIEKYVSLGVKCDVSEYDCIAYDWAEYSSGEKIYENGITKKREYEQAAMLKSVFDVYKEFSDNMDRVTFWTYADGRSFQNNDTVFPRTDYAGIFDRNFKAKPQYYAIALTDAELEEKMPDYTNAFKKLTWNFENPCDATDVRDRGGWTRINTNFTPSKLPLSVVTDSGTGISGNSVIAAQNMIGTAMNGIKIKLSTDQIEAGKRYKLKFDSRIGGTNAADYTGAYIYADTYRPVNEYTEMSPRNTPDFLGADSYIAGKTTAIWQSNEGIVEPKPEDFVNGYTELYLAAAQYGGGKALSKDIIIYFDNIELVPLNDEIELRKWDFESAETSQLGDSLSTQLWTGFYSDTTKYDWLNPTRISVEKVLYRNTTENLSSYWWGGYKDSMIYDSGERTRGAEGSDYCIRVQTGKNDYNYKTIGIRKKLSSDFIQPGRRYIISFYTMDNTAERNLYCKLNKPSVAEPSVEQFWRINWFDTSSPPRNDVTKRHWVKCSFEIEPTEEDFENGWTVLWLGAYAEALMLNEAIYFDDIRMTTY